MKNVFRQGEIIWMDFNPQAGHEQAGRRPALVVSSSQFNATGALAMVCPITHTKARRAVRPELPEGLRAEGCVLCDHARFVDLAARNAVHSEAAPTELVQSVLNTLHALLPLD